MLNRSYVFLSQRSKANAQMTHIQNKKQTKTEEKKKKKQLNFQTSSPWKWFKVTKLVWLHEADEKDCFIYIYLI